jgi:soluble lytic murein transglycosylase-like protein
MQTLVSTARQALGRRELTGEDLLDPALSIQAGTAYIAQQRFSTRFDPPLVAAAYNAGSLRRDDSPSNRWKLLCFPVGTGQYVDRYVAWFGDCMRVSAAEGWGKQEGVPSFAECFASAVRAKA